MKDEKYKVMVKGCKECGKEFEMGFRSGFARRWWPRAKEDGETPVFTGRCPDCQERDPFLKLLKSTRITPLGSLSRRIKR